MKYFSKKRLIAAVLCSVVLVTGCEARKETPTVISVAESSSRSSSSVVNSTSSAFSSIASSSVSSIKPFSSTSTAPVVNSSVQSNAVEIQTSEPHFSFSHNEPLPIPVGESIPIRSLTEVLGKFSEISLKTPDGSPEEIVKTLLERNILCFAAMQGKCWTSSETNGIAPIQSNYINSAEQVSDLFYGTYTENQAWRLMHPQEVGGYGDVFQYNEDGQLCFDLYHLRRNNGGSFESPTYAIIVSSSDSEIVFERFYTSNPSDNSAKPNNMDFRAVKENGAWRLENYITDAPAFAPLYSELIKTKRIGAPELMELAKEQVGNIGGRKYWEWYGFDQHVEWCAAFVSWCYAQAGKSEPFFTGCYTGANWFMERDQWGNPDYHDIAPADCIFFDWDLNGSADHVGLVLGTDGTYVYTIEGNRDDICITRGYPLDFKYIMGYGLMNW